MGFPYFKAICTIQRYTVMGVTYIYDIHKFWELEQDIFEQS